MIPKRGKRLQKNKISEIIIPQRSKYVKINRFNKTERANRFAAEMLSPFSYALFRVIVNDIYLEEKTIVMSDRDACPLLLVASVIDGFQLV